MGNTDVGAIARAGTDTCTDFTAFDDTAVTTRLGPVVAVSPEDGSTAWMLPADGRVQGPPTRPSTTRRCTPWTATARDEVDRAGSLRTARRAVATRLPSGRGTRLYMAGGDGLMALDLPDQGLSGVSGHREAAVPHQRRRPRAAPASAT